LSLRHLVYVDLTVKTSYINSFSCHKINLAVTKKLN
jgi:hypothetical protein